MSALSDPPEGQPPPGTPGQEPAQGAPPEGQAPPSNGGQQPPEPPPWGDDFSAERAWQTITSQRNTERELKLKVQALERESMTELDRTKAERDQYRQERDQAVLEGMRHRIAVAKGLPAEAIQFLAGSTQEELEANADKLKGLVGAGGPTPPPDFGAGARPPAGNGAVTDSEGFSAMLRRAAGRNA